MKKIIPFNNVLKFNTDVREITAISLEHEIKKYPDMISGSFYISGEYKITDGQLDREKFNFELPFDIALSNNYELESLLVDIDDFRYDLISDSELKVNIDLYIDGTVVEEPIPKETTIEPIDFNLRDNYEEENTQEENITIINNDKEDDIEEVQETEESTEVIEPERIDLLKEMLTTNKEETMPEELNINNNNTNEDTNINLFDNSSEENYVTYRVYKVEESDTIDTILSKYNITKEMLADYNNIENITPGDKLIIPANEK